MSSTQIITFQKAEILLEYIYWTLANVSGLFLLEFYLFLEYCEALSVTLTLFSICGWFDISVYCVHSSDCILEYTMGIARPLASQQYITYTVCRYI